jgi:GAF domain-containing protein
VDPSRRLLDSITRAHERFVHDGDRRVAFDLLLEDLLALTESEYGFIGEVLPGAPNDETRRLVAERGGAGLAFRDLDDLFGAAIRTGAMVVSNDPASDPRSALSSGPPFLRSFLGLPVRVGDRLVGMVGLANRPGGYDEALARSFDPLLATCAT